MSTTVTNINTTTIIETSGKQGPPGAGMPAGGTTGQVLAKASALPNSFAWVDPPKRSTDPENRITAGADSGLFVPELLIDPLAYYILAKDGII